MKIALVDHQKCLINEYTVDECEGQDYHFKELLLGLTDGEGQRLGTVWEPMNLGAGLPSSTAAPQLMKFWTYIHQAVNVIHVLGLGDTVMNKIYQVRLSKTYITAAISAQENKTKQKPRQQQQQQKNQGKENKEQD